MQAREFSLDVENELEFVWEALTTPHGLSSWYVLEADIDARPGGKVTVDWGAGPVGLAEVDEIEAPHRLKLVYRDEDDRPTGAEEWLLTHDDGVTHVRLVHSLPVAEGATWDDTYPGIVRGWSLFMGTLAFVANRRSRLGRDADARIGDLGSGAWKRVLTVLGLGQTPEPGEHINLPEAGPAEVLVSVDGFSLLFAVGEEATLLIDVEGESLYTVAATYGGDSAALIELKKRLVEVAELACEAAAGG
jgi:uncharacterized protein YndB with AHSA1/START domain